MFRNARTPYVVCIDCHVLLAPGSLRWLIDYFHSHPDCRDLLQGPCYMTRFRASPRISRRYGTQVCTVNGIPTNGASTRTALPSKFPCRVSGCSPACPFCAGCIALAVPLAYPIPTRLQTDCTITSSAGANWDSTWVPLKSTFGSLWGMRRLEQFVAPQLGSLNRTHPDRWTRG